MKHCECCKKMWHAAGDFPCGCMDELVCRTCNRCKDHCECSPEQQVLDIPFPEQLTIARHEWLALGVAI